jgi:hypothetical protein
VDLDLFMKYADMDQKMSEYKTHIRAHITRAIERGMYPRSIFQALDSSGDGELDRDELVQGFQTLKMPISKKESELIFDFIDADWSGFITLPEFFKFAAPPSEEDDLLEEQIRLFMQQLEKCRDEKFLCFGINLWKEKQCKVEDDLIRGEAHREAANAEEDRVDFKSEGNHLITVRDFLSGITELGFHVAKIGPGSTGAHYDGTPGALRRMRVRRIVDSDWFLFLVSGSILLNTVILATEFEGQSAGWIQANESMNIVLTVFFTIELSLRWYAYGTKELLGIDFTLELAPLKLVERLRKRFRNTRSEEESTKVAAPWELGGEDHGGHYGIQWFNLMDVLIVVLADIELMFVIIETFSSAGSIPVNATVLRTFRLQRVFRIFRFAETWQDLRTVIHATIETLSSLNDFMSILLVVLVVYALIGMDTFGGKMTASRGFLFIDDGIKWDEEEVPRANFNSFPLAMISVFQIGITAEDWQYVMYDCMKATGPISGAVFCVSLVFIGHYVLISLFISILIDNFQDANVATSSDILRLMGEAGEVSTSDVKDSIIGEIERHEKESKSRDRRGSSTMESLRQITAGLKEAGGRLRPFAPDHERKSGGGWGNILHLQRHTKEGKHKDKEGSNGWQQYFQRVTSQREGGDDEDSPSPLPRGRMYRAWQALGFGRGDSESGATTLEASIEGVEIEMAGREVVSMENDLGLRGVSPTTKERRLANLERGSSGVIMPSTIAKDDTGTVLGNLLRKKGDLQAAATKDSTMGALFRQKALQVVEQENVLLQMKRVAKDHHDRHLPSEGGFQKGTHVDTSVQSDFATLVLAGNRRSELTSFPQEGRGIGPKEGKDGQVGREPSARASIASMTSFGSVVSVDTDDGGDYTDDDGGKEEDRRSSTSTTLKGVMNVRNTFKDDTRCPSFLPSFLYLPSRFLPSPSFLPSFLPT